MASRWPTPRACSGKRSSGGNRTEFLRLWPTPRAGEGDKWSAGKQRDDSLQQRSRQWATPQAHDAQGAGNPNRVGRYGTLAGGRNLNDEAALWATPAVADVDGGRMHRSGKRSNELLLKGQAAIWATPSARDWKSGQASPETLARNSRPLNEQAVNLHSRPAPATKPDGRNTSAGAPTLNPQFVELLMGWPIGWTGFAFAATEWSRWSRHMRCELSRLTSPGDDGAEAGSQQFAERSANRQ